MARREPASSRGSKSRRTIVCALALLLSLLASCTGRDSERGSDAERGSADGSSPSAGQTEEGDGTSPPTPEPQRRRATEPLVIAIHMTRPPVDLRRAAARRVLQGATRPVGAARLVGAPGTALPDSLQAATARAAVRAVVADPRTVAVVPARAVGPQVQAVRVDDIHPIRSPRRYPLRTGAASQNEPVVRMSVVGDIMLGRGVAEAAQNAGDPSLALRPMQERLAAAGITVGNLENTLSRDGTPTQGGDSFAAPPAVIGGLRDAGFDVLSLANNHLGDFGDQALVKTVRRLRDGGVKTFGAGRDLSAAWEPAIVRRAGVRFGFLGFNAIGETPEVGPNRPGAVSVSMPPRTGPLDRAELRRFERAVRLLQREADVVVAMPHWGTQYTNVPEPIQRRVGRRIVEAGADVVVGGHPHWVQGSQMVQGSLLVHSLGNFIFDMDFMEETQKGLLLELTFWGDDLKAADFVPYAMDDDFAPRVQSFREGRETLRLMWDTSGPAFRR